MKKYLGHIKDNVSTKYSAVLSGFTLPTLSQDHLLKWFGEITDSKASIYDKAMDSEYLRTKIGGGNHRLFDGGHDLISAWEKAKNASSDDTLAQEVIGFVSGVWKDVTTVKGLPFATVDKGGFDSWAEAVNGWGIPGLNSKYLYDLLSFDALEILSTSLGVVGVVFALKAEDKEKLAEILGSMGIVSIASANPIMGVFTIVMAAYGYKKKKAELCKKSLLKGSTMSVVSMGLFALLGLPFLVELVLVLIVSLTLKKHLFERDDLLEYFKTKALKSYEVVCDQVASGTKLIKRKAA